MEVLPFFVYGTLKRGQANERVWPCRPQRVVLATTKGALFDLGAYPCMLPGDDNVSGELWFVSPTDFAAALDALDWLEDCRQRDDDLYCRQIVECQSESASLRAYTFFYNQSLPLNHRRIEPDATGHVTWPPRPPLKT